MHCIYEPELQPVDGWAATMRVNAPANRESGQVMVSLLLMLALFLLAMMGFAVDLTNLWFHRQAAQSAADSACQAGAMDMSALIAGLTLPNTDIMNEIKNT